MIPRRRNTGRAWERDVIELAHRYGWRVATFRAARIQRKDGSTHHATPVGADGKGFPDLVLVRERVIFAELKSGKGALTIEQHDWIAALVAAGQEIYVWRDTDVNAVIATLARRAA